MTPALPHPALGTPSGDPLAGLRGLHLPPEIGFWPPAPGWIALALVLVGLAVLAVVVRYRRRTRLEARALRELARLESARPTELAALAAALAELVRKVALERFGRARVASLTGERWQRFLRESVSSGGFDDPSAALLAAAPYAPPAVFSSAGAPAGETVAPDRLLAQTRAWIRATTGRSALDRGASARLRSLGDRRGRRSR